MLRRLAVLLAGLVACAVVAPSALAHATLLRAQPRDRQVLAEAPVEVRLHFSEPVRSLGGIRVVRNGGASVLRGKPHVVGRDLLVPLRKLGDGDYTVLWRVLSDDGHLETGVLAFGVGAGRAPPQPSLVAGGTLTVRDLVSRFLVFAGLLLAAGTVVFRILVWRVAARGLGRPPHELALLLGGFT
ncbi:MAG: copper transport protein, partial [Gaiellaceae bacterium]|nr:copper transport protein [Gaiellaceae bacterium]